MAKMVYKIHDMMLTALMLLYIILPISAKDEYFRRLEEQMVKIASMLYALSCDVPKSYRQDVQWGILDNFG